MEESEAQAGRLEAQSDGSASPSHLAALSLAVLAILGSALYLWLPAGSKVWQVLCPAYSAPLLWAVLVLAYAFVHRRSTSLASSLPPISVLAYLAVNLMSMAFAREATRTVSFEAKLVVTYVAGYALFRAALRNQHSVQLLLRVALTTVAIAITASLMIGFGTESGWGFHARTYQYGTYVAVLASLGSVYLLAASGWRRVAGAVLIAAAILSSGTLGTLLAVAASVILLLVLRPDWKIGMWGLGALVLGTGLSSAFGASAGNAIQRDMRLMEADGNDVRQRYIEWQAQINLLEDRAMIGAGGGAINDYRSTYYHRLPKRNTLAAFDQNGWLATAAETGILGLAAFCWVVAHYGRRAWRSVHQRDQSGSVEGLTRVMMGATAALGASLVANLFSSVQYHGTLVAFVFVLSLVSVVDMLLGGSACGPLRNV